MYRKRFFFFERLRIPRRERIAVGVLLGGVLFFHTAVYFLEQKIYYDEEYYQELEQIFGERSRLVKQERETILERYDPGYSFVIDSVPAQTTDAGPRESGVARIDINRAGTDQLQKLPGVGPAYARRIVDWRERNGAFSSPDQLLDVRGIGPARLEAILPWIELSQTIDADTLSR